MAINKRTAVITGGAQGIGLCLVREFLKAGYFVAAADNDSEAGAELKASVKEAKNFLYLECDVSSEKEVEQFIKSAARKFHGIDVLINNAGIGINKPVTELTLKEWNRVIGVNLTGAFLCAKHAAGHIGNNNGCIINIASTRGIMSEKNTESYSASKGGIIALTHALAVSLGPKVRVNCISPGWIEVSNWKKKSAVKNVIQSRADRLQHPAGRVGTPYDIAEAALFLASKKAGFITGQNFIIDGGMTKKMIYV
ncbi:MAG: glucose 1-dehydrogenase [Candidatus Goldiibacteriota bacterium]|jgi:NAD(P)-dependent dehydrogenase (short-subunit alcohol dehydrogenase family)